MADKSKIAKKAVKAVKKKAVAKAARTVERKAFRMKGWLLGLVLIVAGAGGAFTFVPEEKVPEQLEPLHSTLLAWRNTAVAKVAPDTSRYDDTAVIEIPGRTPIKLYFAPSPNIKQGLCDFIAGAKSTIDICIFDLDLNEVAKALIAAKARKVSVRVVTDEDNAMMDAVEKLRNAGIRVVPDGRAALMHNKFVIADAKNIWTGSYNFTINGTRKNDNNAVVIESPRIAACYQEKFNEYFNGKFGKKASLKTFGGSESFGELALRTAFSPSDGVRNLLLDELSAARKSIRVMAFSFTDQQIADKLAECAKKGIHVECLFDYGQANSKFSRSSYLRGCGIKIAMSPNRSGKMHHKVIIIDDETVITGSYNYSKNAEVSNDENILIMKNAKIASRYVKEFKRCWRGTKGYM